VGAGEKPGSDVLVLPPGPIVCPCEAHNGDEEMRRCRSLMDKSVLSITCTLGRQELHPGSVYAALCLLRLEDGSLTLCWNRRVDARNYTCKKHRKRGPEIHSSRREKPRFFFCHKLQNRHPSDMDRHPRVTFIATAYAILAGLVVESTFAHFS